MSENPKYTLRFHSKWGWWEDVEYHCNTWDEAMAQLEEAKEAVKASGEYESISIRDYETDFPFYSVNFEVTFDD